MLTDTQIRSLRPADKAKKYSDGGGLYLYVPKNGSKLWRMAYTFNKKEKLLSFGKYPIVSLKEAREKRDEAKRLIADGVDPGQQKQESKRAAIAIEANTLEYVFQEWYDTQTVNNTEKDRARKRYIYTKFLAPTLRTKQVADITALDLLMIAKPLEKEGRLPTAHKVLQTCNMIFRYAMATARVTQNVAIGLRWAIRWHEKQHRPTITSPVKIGELLNKLDNYPGHFHIKCALRLYPLLFVRSVELSCAQWDEFQFERNEWHIPAERMKMRKPHIVPLSTQACTILQELKLYTGGGAYLFPSRNDINSPIHYSSPLQALRSLGYTKDEMCIHGFRSMASTLLNERGYNRDWIERQLAHKEKDTSRYAYNHAQYLPQRHRMMQDWADLLDGFREMAKQAQ